MLRTAAPEAPAMDKIDLKILDLLQQNCLLTADEVGEKVGLSKVPCWRRIQRLRETGVIRQNVALLDRRALNLAHTVFVMVKTAAHNQEWFEKFSKTVQDIPEIVELHRLAGDVDYLLRIVVPDAARYDAVYRKLIAAISFQDVNASFVLDTLKATTAVPLSYAAAGSSES